MPELTPVPQGDDFDWDYISSKMIGRFEQYESIPEELQSLVVKCNLTTCKKEKCRDCAYWRTYEFFVSEGKTGRDFDLYCAKHGSYGPWRHEADPETYLYRGAKQSWWASQPRNQKLISEASRQGRRPHPTLPYLHYS